MLPCESPLETGKASRFCLLLPCRSQRIQFLLRKPSREALHQHCTRVQGDRHVQRSQPLLRQCLPTLGSLHWPPRMFAADSIGSRAVVGIDEVIPIALFPPLFRPTAWVRVVGYSQRTCLLCVSVARCRVAKISRGSDSSLPVWSLHLFRHLGGVRRCQPLGYRLYSDCKAGSFFFAVNLHRCWAALMSHPARCARPPVMR